MIGFTWLLPLVLCVPVFGAGCDAGVGDWKWFNGGVASIQKNQTLVRDGKPAGWECTDAGRGVMIWSTRINKTPAPRTKT